MHSLEPLKLRHETSHWSQGQFYSMFLFVFFEQTQGRSLWSPTGGGHEVHESHGSRDGWRHCWTFPEEGKGGFGKLDESWMLLKLKPPFNCPLERTQIVGFSCQPVNKIASNVRFWPQALQRCDVLPWRPLQWLGRVWPPTVARLWHIICDHYQDRVDLEGWKGRKRTSGNPERNSARVRRWGVKLRNEFLWKFRSRSNEVPAIFGEPWINRVGKLALTPLMVGSPCCLVNQVTCCTMEFGSIFRMY